MRRRGPHGDDQVKAQAEKRDPCGKRHRGKTALLSKLEFSCISPVSSFAALSEWI